MGNNVSKKIIPSRDKLLKLNTQDSTKRSVVVFDIDNTLCKSDVSPEETEFARKYDPECPIIEYKHNQLDVFGHTREHTYGHVFLPYLQILFDYLLDQGARIAFFSSANKERNSSVIPELLKLILGTKKYQSLKSKGQFDIFSREDLRTGHSIGREGSNVKDLKVVIRDTESLLDCILVEDDPTYTAHDQEPCLYIMNLEDWILSYSKETRDYDNNCKNSTYYMLGLFKTYFEQKEFNKMPIRVALDQILHARKNEFFCLFKDHPIASKMLHIGLEQVQKKVPGARLYKTEKYAPDCGYTEQPLAPQNKFFKETKYDSFARNLRIGNIPLSMYYLAESLFETFRFAQIAGANDSEEFCHDFVVNLIEKLKDTEDVSIEIGPKIHDACIIPKGKFDVKRKYVTTLLSFVHKSSEEKLENAAKIALLEIQPQVDVKKLCYEQIVSVGIAFSAKSLLAAYDDHYEDQTQIYLTDIYTR